MEAQKYLQYLEDFETSIRQKKQALKDMYSMIVEPKGVDTTKDRVKASSSGDAPFVHALHKLKEYENALDKDIERYVNEKEKRIKQIQKLHKKHYPEILYKRYIQYKSLLCISDEMGYSYQYIKELHGKALREFQNTYLCTPKPTTNIQ